MAKIFYSMAGEGRGHATRVRSVVEQLRHEHQLVLFAPDQAYEFLAPRYPAGFPNVEVRPLPGLRFHYSRGRLDLMKSIAHGLGYLWRLPGLVRNLKRTIQEERPDLVIADFEPSLPRAARAAGIPFLSLNHQHFLVACDLSSLPTRLRHYAKLMKLAVHAHHTGQQATIVSSFFRAPLRKKYEHVLQVGPLLRPEIRERQAETGDFLLSYLRPNTPRQVLDVLRKSRQEVRVYGLGSRPSEGPLRFFPVSETTFVDDLAQCRALVGAAGNQSLGEALYLGKPVLALPEEDHHEQMINAHFLQSMNAGRWTNIESFEERHFFDFLEGVEDQRGSIATHRPFLDGTPAAVREICRHLPGGSNHFSPNGLGVLSEPPAGPAHLAC